MDLDFNPFEDIFDPFGIIDFGKDQYNANRDYGHTRELMDSQHYFDEWMSSSAYQRAMVDMGKAGLNPMLAYQQGGASSHGGGAPVVNRASNTGGSIATAAQVENVRADTDLKKAQAENVRAEKGGKVAESQRLAYEMENVVPLQYQTARLKQDLLKFEKAFKGMEYEVGMENKAALLRDYFRAHFQELPQDVKGKMYDLSWKRLRSNVSDLADKGVAGVKSFSEYAGTQLGKFTNSAGDFVRRSREGYESFHRSRQH